MKTLFDLNTRQELLGRLTKLTLDSPAQWGKMAPHQMIAHINGALKTNLGELTVTGEHNAIKAAIFRILTFSPLPIPKAKAETFPEIKMTGTYDMAEEKKAFGELLERFGKASGKENWPDSPIFGKLNARKYGKLAYKHTDHHFRQFGI